MTSDTQKTTRIKVMFGDVSLPPGGVKIAKAFRALLENKNFESITTAEIAAASGMTEALIYKYFRSKREMLYSLMLEFHNAYYAEMERNVEGVDGSLEKLRQIVWGHVNIYEQDRVYGRLLILELGGLQGFHDSAAYKKIKNDYSKLFIDIIEKGKQDGEIRADVSARSIRQGILGMVHYMCLPGIIFGRKIVTDEITNDICEIIFSGIRKQP
jgi:TetR/AcrR family transcriptional regulator, fatty acid metabolism regulator protein